MGKSRHQRRKNTQEKHEQAFLIHKYKKSERNMISKFDARASTFAEAEAHLAAQEAEEADRLRVRLTQKFLLENQPALSVPADTPTSEIKPWHMSVESQKRSIMRRMDALSTELDAMAELDSEL